MSNARLNDDQKEAVYIGLKNKEITNIHGPPGTGKTTTLVAYLKEEYMRTSRILACAASNNAADNLVEKFLETNIHYSEITRLAHPCRVRESLHYLTLNHKVCKSIQERAGRPNDNMKESLKIYLDEMATLSRRDKSYKRIKELEEQIRNIYSDEAKKILKDSPIIVSTLSTAGSKTISDMLEDLVDQKFDVCGIDECTQAHEGLSWIPLIFSKKAVLAGDHK